MHIKNGHNLKVSILPFLSGCILALPNAVSCPLKKILAVNIRNLLLRMHEAIVYLVERDCKFAMFWPPIRKVYLLYADAQEHLLFPASIIYQGLVTCICSLPNHADLLAHTLCCICNQYPFDEFSHQKLLTVNIICHVFC